MAAYIPLDESELKARLNPEQYKILREKGTERPFSSPLLNMRESGQFACAACGQMLFSSESKFDSNTGWPSFDQALHGAVKFIPDNSQNMQPTEVVCAACGSHLGHVFDDLPAGRQAGHHSKTGQRFCINGACLVHQKTRS